jgi:hypothetical protein
VLVLVGAVGAEVVVAVLPSHHTLGFEMCTVPDIPTSQQSVMKWRSHCKVMHTWAAVLL